MNEIRSTLEERLNEIRDRLIAMIDTVAIRTESVTRALLENDVARADALIVGDDEIDLQSQELEDLCVDTLIREQPVATDLRAVLAAMHMNTDVERSGDLTTNIAKAVGRLQGANPDDRIRDLILRMSAQAKLLFERSAEAYRTLDGELAASIDELDDVLDDLHYLYIETVLQEAKRQDLLPQQSLQFALIGRFYERIGDHAENMGERIRYIIDGWQPESTGADRARAARTGQLEDPKPSRGLAVIDSIAEDRRIDAIRRDFVANVSHELKTPVGAISLIAETLDDETDAEMRAKLMSRLGKEVFRVENIIDDLLELTRLEEKPPELVSLPIDVVVSEAADTAAGLAAGRGISVATVGLPSNANVLGDRRQLVRALTNLIDNAVRYSDSETHVTVTVEALPGVVDISVTDQGVGIPRAELERIFERFYRVDSARSRDTGGTGLGLSIVRHVADNHLGRTMVESKPGHGSTFTLELPRAE